MDQKWDELYYELTTGKGVRSLTITPHFQKIPGGWFHTGQYTITENGKLLGNLYMDVYTDGPLQWDGSKDEFISKELEAFACYISFKDVAHLPDPF
jgi:hypothetical protein